THDKLAHQKPGSLSVSQTQFLGELDNDLASDATKISAVWNQKQQVDATDRLARANEQGLERREENLKKHSADFDQYKLDRVRKELMGRMPTSQAELVLLNSDPAQYIKNYPDTKQEAKFRERITDGFTDLAKDNKAGKQAAADAAKALDYSQKVDNLDGVNTDAVMISGLAKDAIQESEAHMKAIPAKGPERLPRMEAALNHDAAVVGINSTIRNNSDARIDRFNLSHQEVQLVYANEARGLGEDPVAKSKESVDKVIAEETEIKKGAFDAAKTAAADSDNLRKSIGSELDAAQAKLPKNLQLQRAGDIQKYKDALALQQVQTQAAVGELGADLDPKVAEAELDRGRQIIKDDLETVHPSRINAQQAGLDHQRNQARGEALVSLSNAATAVAGRAQTQGGMEYGKLVVNSLATAGQNAMDLRETVTIDRGGIQTPDSKEVQEALSKQAQLIDDKVKTIND